MPVRPALLALASLLVLSACGTASRAPAYGGLDEVTVVSAGTANYERARGGRVAEAGYYVDGVQVESESAATRKLIRNASVELGVPEEEDAEAAVDAARALAEQADGYVAFEGPGSITLRIPDARLDATLDALAALGRERRRDVRTADVTAQFTDLEIRLANARALQTRLRALLDQAESVEDVLAVERELARVTTEVEQLEGQMRLLQNQIAYSTVAVRVVAEGEEVRPGPLGWVFVGAYEAVKWLLVWD